MLLLVLRSSWCRLRLDIDLGFSLGLHLVVVCRSREINSETTLLTSSEEHDKTPDKSSNEQDPDQGAQASNGGQDSQTSLEENDILAITLVENTTVLAVDETAVTVAVTHSHGHNILGSSRSSSSPGGEPENEHQRVETKYSNDVV